MRSLVLVVVLYNCRSSVTWVSDKGGKVRGVAIVPFRKDRHHHTPLDYTANIFWKHLASRKRETSSHCPLSHVPMAWAISVASPTTARRWISRTCSSVGT